MTYLHCARCGTTIHMSGRPRMRSCPRCLAAGEDPVPALAAVPPEEVSGYADIEIVRRAFRLLALGDRRRLLALFADDFEGHPISRPDVIRGPAEVGKTVEEANRGQNRLEADAYRFESNGRGQVGAFGRLRVRGPSGIIDSPAAWIYWVEDGKIKRATSYTNATEAERALHGIEV